MLPADDNLTKLNLIMASGNLPDIVSYSNTDSKATFDKYAASGAIIPLDDLIDQYAPHIKAFFEKPPYDMPSLKADSKGADGKIYSLPSTTEIGTGEIYAIRQDWLDKVNMKVPETTDDLYKVLKAFKDNNLSGDGNTIPFCPDSGLPDLAILMNAFGAHESFYADSTDNTIKYGPLDERYKEDWNTAISFIKKGLSTRIISTLTIPMRFVPKLRKRGWPYLRMAAERFRIWEYRCRQAERELQVCRNASR